VAIDALSPVVMKKEETIAMIPQLTNDILNFEKKLASGVRPNYTHEEILQKLLRTHVGGVDAESCKTLMTRGTRESPPGSGRYEFTHDIRVHYMPITGMSMKQVKFIATNFRYEIHILVLP